MDWTGATVVVTGASRGIGRSVAGRAAARGAHVALLARSEPDLESARTAIGGSASAHPVDVTDAPALRSTLQGIESDRGRIDVLVNNAGAGAYGSFLDTDEDRFITLMDLNFHAVVTATKAVLPGMVQRRSGHVVNLASIAGRMGPPFESAYAATKFALVGLTESLAVEMAPFGVGVSMVNPGPVDTDFFTARGHEYAGTGPRPVSADRVATAVMAAVEGDRLEQVVPRWLRAAYVLRTIAPPLYRRGTARAFRRELDGLVDGVGPPQ